VDRCGIAVVSHLGNVEMVREGMDIVEVLPKFAVDLAISIQPNPTHQLDISHVRQWIMQLVSFWGINVVNVSYDGFQSKESITMLRRAGIRSSQISVDRGTEAYELLRDAVYDGRVLLYDNDILRQELVTLEYYSEKKKVDHPPKGSKDISDAVAGALYAASNSRGIRATKTVQSASGDRVLVPHATQRRNPVRRASRYAKTDPEET
jgi:hypothetical protein